MAGGNKRRGRGEGSIEERDGKFRAVLSLGKDPATGNRLKMHSDFLPTKREALAWLRARQAERDQGKLADTGRQTVAEWLTRWLEIRKGKVGATTWDNLDEDVRLRLVPNLGALPLAQLRPLHVEQFYAKLTERGVPAGRQAKAGATLRAALADAVRLQLLPSNPAEAVDRPQSRRAEIHPLTPEQARALLAAATGHPFEALYVLALDAGMRQGELFGLLWDAVDLAAGVVTVKRSLVERDGRHTLKEPKTPASRRRIRLHPQTVALLAERRKKLEAENRAGPDRPVFPGPRGGWLRRSNVQRRYFAPLLKKAGLPPTRFHNLRHTMATLLLLRGVNVKAVSRRLGHSSVRITLDVYAHCLPEMEDQVVSVLGGLYFDCRQQKAC